MALQVRVVAIHDLGRIPEPVRRDLQAKPCEPGRPDQLAELVGGLRILPPVPPEPAHPLGQPPAD